MRNPRAFVFVLALLAVVFAAIPRARADDADLTAATNLLTSGQWKITRNGVSDIRIFAKDGTYTTVDKKDDTGQWIMTKDFVIIILPGGHKDALSLPLNPKGTDGYSDNGDPLTAVRQNAPIVPIAATTPAPTPAIGPAAGILPPPSAPATVNTQSKADATAMLLSKPWMFLGPSWWGFRYFDKNGTFTTTNKPKEHGTWEVTDKTINLLFADGHTDAITLPLRPKNGDGVDVKGGRIAIIGADPAVQASGTVVQSSMDAFFHAPKPPARISADEQASITSVLVAAPWRFFGLKWTSVRIFAADGTFTTAGRKDENGTWSIENNQVRLRFTAHTDILALPLDPRGTNGADVNGDSMVAIDEALLPGATPAQATQPGTSPAPGGGTQKPPNYFGTQDQD